MSETLEFIKGVQYLASYWKAPLMDKNYVKIGNGFEDLTKQAKLVWAEHKQLQAENEKLKEALEKIANADYRGNRSSESVIAFNALKLTK